MTSLNSKMYHSSRSKKYNVYTTASPSSGKNASLSFFDVPEESEKFTAAEGTNEFSFTHEIESKSKKSARSRESRKTSSRKRRSRFRVSPVRSRSLSISSTPSNASRSKREVQENKIEHVNRVDDRRMKTRERRKHARQLAKAAFNESHDEKQSNFHQPLQHQNFPDSSKRSESYDMRSSNTNTASKQKSVSYQYSRTKSLHIPSQLERIKKKKNYLANSPRNSLETPTNKQNNSTTDQFNFDAAFPDDPQQTDHQTYNNDYIHTNKKTEKSTKNFFDEDPFSKPSTMKQENPVTQSKIYGAGVLERRRRRHPSLTADNTSNSTSMNNDDVITPSNSVRSKDSYKSNSSLTKMTTRASNHFSSRKDIAQSTFSDKRDFFAQSDANTTSSKTTIKSTQSSNSYPNNERYDERQSVRNSIKTINIPQEQGQFQADALSTVSSGSISFRFDAFGIDAEIDNEVTQWMQDINTNDPETQELGMKASKDIAFFFDADFENNSPFESYPMNASVRSGTSNRSNSMQGSFTKEKNESFFSQPSNGTNSSSNSTDAESWAFREDNFNSGLSQKKIKEISHGNESKNSIVTRNASPSKSFTATSPYEQKDVSNDFTFDVTFPEQQHHTEEYDDIKNHSSNKSSDIRRQHTNLNVNNKYEAKNGWSQSSETSYKNISQTPSVSESESESNSVLKQNYIGNRMNKDGNVQISETRGANEELSGIMSLMRVKTDDDLSSQNELKRHETFKSRRNQIYAQSEVNRKATNFGVTKLLETEQEKKRNGYKQNYVSNAKAQLSANIGKEGQKKVDSLLKSDIGNNLSTSQQIDSPNSIIYDKVSRVSVKTQAFESIQQRSKLRSTPNESYEFETNNRFKETHNKSEIDLVRQRMREKMQRRNENDEIIHGSLRSKADFDSDGSKFGVIDMKPTSDEVFHDTYSKNEKEILKDSDSYYSKNSRTSTIVTSRTASTTRTESPIFQPQHYSSSFQQSKSVSSSNLVRDAGASEGYSVHGYNTPPRGKVKKFESQEQINYLSTAGSVKSENSSNPDFSREQNKVEEKSETSSTQERDVASLIRRRIAKNKEVIATSPQRIQNDKEPLDFNAARNNLRKIRITRPPPAPPAEYLRSPGRKEGGIGKDKSNLKHFPDPRDESLEAQTIKSKDLSHNENRELINNGLHKANFESDLSSLDSTRKKKSGSEKVSKLINDEGKAKLNSLFSERSLSIKKTPNINDEVKGKLNALFAERSKVQTESMKEKGDKTRSSALSASEMVLNQIKSLNPEIEGSHEINTVDDLQDNVSRNGDTLSSQNTEKAPSDTRLALKNDPKYQKYFKMLKVGLPLPVVQHAMTRDGLDPEVMNGDHSKPAGFIEGIPLKQDPKYVKYFKMLKVGLPIASVKHSMERDGLDPNVMDGDHNAPASTSSVSVLRKLGSPKKTIPKDTHRRTRLHWNTLKKVRQNSVWDLLNQDSGLNDINIDENEFNQLFQAELNPSNKKDTSAVGKASKRKNVVKVIEPKRATNGGIILARIRVSFDHMAQAIDMMDDRVMNQQQLTGIMEYLPSPQEKRLLKSYLNESNNLDECINELCECEKFMVSMLTVSHAKRKVRALIFKLQFMKSIDEVLNDANKIGLACEQLSKSIRLRKLLGIVLNVGNRLNTAGPSTKGKAGAFTLESLLKLNQAKAFDKKTTFLHYIIVIVKRNDEELLTFKDDLSAVFLAGKIYWDQCILDLEEAEDQLENLRMVALKQARQMRPEWVNKRRGKKVSDNCSISDESISLEEEVSMLRSTDIGCFTLSAIKEISALREKVEKTQRTYRKLLEYFGEDEKGGMQTHELFEIIVTFSRNFDSALKEVEATEKEKKRAEKRKVKVDETSNVSNVGGSITKKAVPPRPQPKNSLRMRASSMQPNMSNVINDIKAYAKGRIEQSSSSKPYIVQERSISSIVKETNVPSGSDIKSSISKFHDSKTSRSLGRINKFDESLDAENDHENKSNYASKTNSFATEPSSPQLPQQSGKVHVRENDIGKPPMRTRQIFASDEVSSNNHTHTSHASEESMTNGHDRKGQLHSSTPNQLSLPPVLKHVNQVNVMRKKTVENSDPVESLNDAPDNVIIPSKIKERRSDRMRRSLRSKSRYSNSNQTAKEDLSINRESTSIESTQISQQNKDQCRTDSSENTEKLCRTPERRSDRMRRSLRSQSPHTTKLNSASVTPKKDVDSIITTSAKKDVLVRTPERRSEKMRRSLRSKSPYTVRPELGKEITPTAQKAQTSQVKQSTPSVHERRSERMRRHRQALQSNSNSGTPKILPKESREDSKKTISPAINRTSRFRHAAAAQRRNRSASTKRSNSIGRDSEQERVEWPVSSTANNASAFDSQLDVD